MLSGIISFWPYTDYIDTEGEFGKLIITCSKLIIKLNPSTEEKNELKQDLIKLCANEHKEDDFWTLKEIKCPNGIINELSEIAQTL